MVHTVSRQNLYLQFDNLLRQTRRYYLTSTQPLKGKIEPKEKKIHNTNTRLDLKQLDDIKLAMVQSYSVLCSPASVSTPVPFLLFAVFLWILKAVATLLESNPTYRYHANQQHHHFGVSRLYLSLILSFSPFFNSFDYTINIIGFNILKFAIQITKF